MFSSKVRGGNIDKKELVDKGEFCELLVFTFSSFADIIKKKCYIIWVVRCDIRYKIIIT